MNGQFEVAPNEEIVPRWQGTPLEPWIFGLWPRDRTCELWYQIYFIFYSFIPKGCLGCWKVVYRPKTVVALMKIHDLQYGKHRKQGIYSKCGMESRKFVSGLYNAFWYAPLGCGLEDARKFHKKVARDIRDRVGIQAKVILKHGCTEMEQFTIRAFGVGSDKWDELYEKLKWEKLEKRLEGKYRIDNEEKIYRPQDLERDHQKRKCVEWACSWGDETYLQLTNGVKLFPEPVTYHE